MDISTSLEYTIGTYFTNWLVAHPFLAWSIAHPLPSGGLVLVAILALWGLIKAIGRGIEQIWLFLLTTPFKLIQPILRPIWSAIFSRFGHTNNNDDRSKLAVIVTPTAERIEWIVDRLQHLNQEQETLLSELSTLASTASASTDSGTISDTQYKNMYAKLPKFN
jgi:hypothetical protein